MSQASTIVVGAIDKRLSHDDNRDKKGVNDGAMKHVFASAVGKCGS